MNPIGINDTTYDTHYVADRLVSDSSIGLDQVMGGRLSEQPTVLWDASMGAKALGEQPEFARARQAVLQSQQQRALQPSLFVDFREQQQKLGSFPSSADYFQTVLKRT